MHSSPASLLFVELGAVLIGLAILARLATRLGLSTIPLYLIAGLAFGNGGIAPLPFSDAFLQVGAQIGVLLLLFMLGLEYSGEELTANLRAGLPSGALDLVLNFAPGLAAGLLLHWPLPAAILLGGVTYISSSGVVAKVLGELGRLSNPETAAVVSVLVIEDLAMAVYLPIVALLPNGGSGASIASGVAIAVAAVGLVLIIALRFGRRLSRFVEHQSDEAVLLTTLGLVLLVAGLAERFQVSAAIGAFLVGIALSGPIAHQTQRIFAPLRDLFSAAFFFLVGLEVNPAELIPVAGTAALLALVTGATKILTGYWAARFRGLDTPAGLRAGSALIARGEFSIVIAQLGALVEPALVPLSAAYVLILAVTGPIAMRMAR
jgi:CPA2 family monovalent cation:H+ antiporter-2